MPHVVPSEDVYGQTCFVEDPMPIKRNFFDWQQPLLPAVADHLVRTYARDGQLDLSGVVMVFTGRRASRRFLELLCDAAAMVDKAFLPPRMVTFRFFPEMLYEAQVKFADELTTLLIWQQAIRRIPKKELAAALPHIPADDAVPAWMSLCDSIRAQHNELAEDGMEFDEVSAQLEELGNRDEAKRWTALRRVQSEYLMLLDEFKLWDRQASRLIAVQNQECKADFDIVLVGTVDMNTVVRQMLDQVSDSVTAMIHAPESEADAFDTHGCLNVDRWQDRLLNIPIQDTRIATDPEHQADLVASEIHALNGEYSADEIAIGIGDERLVPRVQQALNSVDLAGRWPVGMTLQNSRPFRLLSGLCDHLNSATDTTPPDFATLSDLVRHPDIADWIERKLSEKGPRYAGLDWLTVLDKYLADHLQIYPSDVLGNRQRASVVKTILTAVQDLLRPLVERDTPVEASGTFPSSPDAIAGQLFADDSLVEESPVHRRLQTKRSLAFWAEGMVRVLNAVYGGRQTVANRPADAAMAECCNQVLELSRTLAKAPQPVVPKCRAAQAIQFVMQQLQDQSVPPEPNDAAIDLMGWLELPMDDSPVMILSGFNEGFIPESINSDVFLPNSFRSRLGLRDNQRRYARDAYALTAMMQSRKRVRLITGRTDSKGNPMIPSRLWFAARPESLPERVQRFFNSEMYPADVAFPASHSPQTDLPESDVNCSRNDGLSGFSVPAPPFIPDAPEEIVVTSFRDYLACPFRYLLRRELRLKYIEDETLELAAPAFGNLIHDVLSEFGQSNVADATSIEAIEDFLLQTLNKTAALRYGKYRSATVNVQLQMVRNRLSSFARWQARTAAEGWRIIHTERALTYDDFRDAAGRHIRLAGRVDRIDFNVATKQWRVLDYKTGETANPPKRTHMKSGEWVDLQLPLYRLLVRSLEITDDVQLGYVHLPNDLSDVGNRMADWTAADLKDAEETARRVAADILDLKISTVAKGDAHRQTEFSRLTQDTVIDRNIPWLESWSGRSID